MSQQPLGRVLTCSKTNGSISEITR